MSDRIAGVIFFSLLALASAAPHAQTGLSETKQESEPGGALGGTVPTPKQPNFRSMDRNNDGGISRTEAADRPHIARHFDAADADRDGKLSREEYRELGNLMNDSAARGGGK